MGTPRVSVPLSTSSGTVGQWDTVIGQRLARRGRRERRGLRVITGRTSCGTRERLRLFSKRKGCRVISVRRHLTKNRPSLPQKS